MNKKTLWIFHANNFLALPMIDRFGLESSRENVFRLSLSTAVFKLITKMWTEQLVAFKTSEWHRMCTNRLCGIFAVPFCVFVGVCVKNPKCDSTFGWKMYEEWLCLSHTTWMEIVIVNAATATATAIAIVVWHNRLCRIDTHRYFFIHRRTQWVSECIVLRMRCPPSECDDVLHSRRESHSLRWLWWYSTNSQRCCSFG